MTGLNDYYIAMANQLNSNMGADLMRSQAAQTGADAQMLQSGGMNALNRAQAAEQPGLAQSENDVRAAQARNFGAQTTGNSLAGGISSGSGLQIGSTLHLAKGTSKVPGKGSGKVDSVKAELAPGEAVLNVGGADHLGRGAIQAINAIGMARMGMIPGNGAPETSAQTPGFAHGTSHVGHARGHYACGMSKVGHYAKGTSKAGKGGKSKAPQAAPSDTPDLSKIDPQMLAAALQMGAMGQQQPGADQQQQAAPQGAMQGMM